MPQPIPQILLPYVKPLPVGSLSLITSVLNATSHWLILRFLLVSLHKNRGDLDGPVPSIQSHANETTIIFVSFTRSLSLWTELCKKLGVDLPSLITSGRLIYVDGLSGAGLSPSGTSQIVHLKSLHLEDVQTAIKVGLSRVASRGQNLDSRTLVTPRDNLEARLILIIDGIDFLLPLHPENSALAVTQLIMTLRTQVDALLLACSADGPLLHAAQGSASPLEKEHIALISTMAHSSKTVIQLRSLDTGAAKDVTGVLRISLGGSVGLAAGEDIEREGEWLYHVKGDGSVRAWARGE